jgi:hypothetical protein
MREAPRTESNFYKPEKSFKSEHKIDKAEQQRLDREK